MTVWTVYRIFVTIFMSIAANELIFGTNTSGVNFSLVLLIVLLFERLYISIRISNG